MIRYYWPILIGGLAAASLTVTIADVSPAARAIIITSFLLVGPGMAFVRLLGIRHFGVQLTVAIALSLALEASLTEALLLARLWSATAAIVILVAISLAGVYLQLRQVIGGRPGWPEDGQAADTIPFTSSSLADKGKDMGPTLGLILIGVLAMKELMSARSASPSRWKTALDVLTVPLLLLFVVAAAQRVLPLVAR